MSKKMFLFIFFSYLIFFVLIPPFQIPDEPEHFENIYWITHLKYPYLPNNPGGNAKLFVRHIIDLYDWNKVNSNGFVLPNFSKIKNSLAQHNFIVDAKNFDRISSQSYHPPLYYIFGSFFYLISNILHLNFIFQYYFVRLTSTLFYFVSIFIGCKILKLIFKKQEDINNVLLFFAINPVSLKMGVGINNEIAVVFFSLLFLYLLLRFDKKVFLLGVFSAAASLSKFSGIFTGLTFVFFTFLKNKFSSKFISNLFKYFFALLVFLFPWFLFNLLRYHNPIQDNFALICKKDLPPYNILQLTFHSLFEFRHTINHYAGFMGWGEPYPFKWFFVSYTVSFSCLFLVGLIRLIRQIGKRNDKNHTLLVYIFSLFIFLFLLDLYRKSQYYSCDIQGRYLLPAFLPMAVVLERGLKSSKTLAYFAVFQYHFILFFVLIPYYYV